MYSSSDDDHEENLAANDHYSGKKRMKLTPMNHRREYDPDQNPIGYGEHMKLSNGFEDRRMPEKPAFMELNTNGEYRTPGKPYENLSNPKVSSFSLHN